MRSAIFALVFLAACGDDEGGGSSGDGSGGMASVGGAGGSTGTDTGTSTGGVGGAGGGGQGGSPDTWTTFAGEWFGTYCVECHEAAVSARDYANYPGVLPDIAEIRCGVTPVALPECSGFPPPGQFPVGTGAKPDDMSRQRLVDWIDAGYAE